MEDNIEGDNIPIITESGKCRRAHFSQAVKAKGFVFVSGQLGFHY